MYCCMGLPQFSIEWASECVIRWTDLCVQFTYRSQIDWLADQVSCALNTRHLQPLIHHLFAWLHSLLNVPILSIPLPTQLTPPYFSTSSSCPPTHSTMSLIDEAKQIAAEFDSGCSTHQLKKCFNEFKRLLVLGLKEDGHDMPCIPSYGICPIPPIHHAVQN